MDVPKLHVRACIWFQLNLSRGTPLGNQQFIKISSCPLWTLTYTLIPIQRWIPVLPKWTFLDTMAWRHNKHTTPSRIDSHTHTYLCAPTCSHSVSSGQVSSCEAPCKLPVITAVLQKFSGGKSGRGGKRKGADGWKKGRQSINSEQRVKDFDFLIHFSSSVCGLCFDEAGLCCAWAESKVFVDGWNFWAVFSCLWGLWIF